MYVLYKDTWGDFDICQSSVEAVSKNLGTLQAEATRLNAARKQTDFKHGEWSYEYRAEGKAVKVL
jgi:hypothetical protein